MSEKYPAIALAVDLLLWLALSMSGLDLQWFGVAIDGGRLKPYR